MVIYRFAALKDSFHHIGCIVNRYCIENTIKKIKKTLFAYRLVQTMKLWCDFYRMCPPPTAKVVRSYKVSFVQVEAFLNRKNGLWTDWRNIPNRNHYAVYWTDKKLQTRLKNVDRLQKDRWTDIQTNRLTYTMEYAQGYKVNSWQSANTRRICNLRITSSVYYSCWCLWIV